MLQVYVLTSLSLCCLVLQIYVKVRDDIMGDKAFQSNGLYFEL